MTTAHRTSASGAAPPPSPIQPCLWFDDQARAAMEYYTEVFPDSRITAVTEYPDEAVDPRFRGMADKVLDGRFTLRGVDFLCLDGGPIFPFTEAVSFSVECADQAEIDYWAALSHVPESAQCGWCKDRFSVYWQIVPAQMAALLVRPAQIQTMLRQTKIVIAELENA